MAKNPKSIPPRNPNLHRHAALCRICAHPQRHEIEREFLSWGSPAKIVTEYNLANRATIYRHAHALNLFPKRDRNIRAALARIIEKVDEVPVKNSGAIVQAIEAYKKISVGWKFDDRLEMNDPDELFECMSLEEYEAYGKDGTLPSWYKKPNGSADSNNSGGGQDA